MIDKGNIKKLFEELDRVLKGKSQLREFTIFGSGALLIQGISSEYRATVDVDMVDPKIDMELQLLCAEVGDKFNLDITWLNSAGYIYSLNFPSGWKERTVPVYKGEALKVKSLSKKDLIATKLYAACSRQMETDLLDLRDLKPSQSELDFARQWILSRPDSKDIEKKLEEIYSTFTKGLNLGRGR